MSNVDSRIGKSAKSEMGETWAALSDSKNYGPDFLKTKIEVVETSLFGAAQTDTDLTIIDALVIDYAGKLVALQIINAGIDYWGKQALTFSAQGRNETKSYKDRASDLLRLRTNLLDQAAQLWPDVQVLLPNRRNRRVSNVPRVRQIVGVNTPDPDLFERAFLDTQTDTTGTL